MSNESTGKRRGRIIRWIAGLLAVYVLSIGPMDRILTPLPGAMGQLAIMIIYCPLVILGSYFRPFAALLSWYCHLFH
jgi:hypothetical protein